MQRFIQRTCCGAGLTGLFLICGPTLGQVPPAPPPWAKAVAAANNAFAGDLYQRLKDGTGNIFFSPYSISSALTMTYQGAKGATVGEMAKVLHVMASTFESKCGATAEEMAEVLYRPAESQTLNYGYAALNEALHGTVKDKGFELSLANALWGQTGEPFLPAFTESLKSNYGAGLEELDFKAAPEPSRLKINAWVESQTHERIKDLLPPNSIDKDTRLVLTNAIYFKAEWEKKFVRAITREGDFRTLGSPDFVKAPFMHQLGQFRYAEDEKCQALELPYVGGELAMVVLLPKPDAERARGNQDKFLDPLKAGLLMLEETFTGEYVAALMGKMAKREVQVTLPKWKVTQKFELSATLVKMGMKRAFVWKEADFTGMAGNPDWYISLVFHKAFVEVDEEGTEAAAATAVVMRKGAARPQGMVEFKADHVFLYVIVHKPSGAILFAGRLADPTKTGGE